MFLEFSAHCAFVLLYCTLGTVHNCQCFLFCMIVAYKWWVGGWFAKSSVADDSSGMGRARVCFWYIISVLVWGQPMFAFDTLSGLSVFCYENSPCLLLAVLCSIPRLMCLLGRIVFTQWRWYSTIHIAFLTIRSRWVHHEFTSLFKITVFSLYIFPSLFHS